MTVGKFKSTIHQDWMASWSNGANTFTVHRTEFLVNFNVGNKNNSKRYWAIVGIKIPQNLDPMNENFCLSQIYHPGLYFGLPNISAPISSSSDHQTHFETIRQAPAFVQIWFDAVAWNLHPIIYPIILLYSTIPKWGLHPVDSFHCSIKTNQIML